jgi:hypothetical protein
MKNALLVIATTPHIRTYLQMTDPKALEQVTGALEAVGEKIEVPTLVDEDLESLILAGASARKVLAQHVNARLDARYAELEVELQNRRAAVRIVKAHKEKQHPVVQKYVDRVLEQMDRALGEVHHEQDMLHYQRVPEEIIGPAMA